MKIIVNVTDESVGVENLPDNVEVELRDYREHRLEGTDGSSWAQDSESNWFVRHTFGGET